MPRESTPLLLYSGGVGLGEIGDFMAFLFKIIVPFQDSCEGIRGIGNCSIPWNKSSDFFFVFCYYYFDSVHDHINKVHYMYKDKKYQEKEVFELFNECTSGLSRRSSVKECYDSVPLRIIPQAVEKIDEEELKKSVEKNRKMIESMRKEENYKRIMAM